MSFRNAPRSYLAGVTVGRGDYDADSIRHNALNRRHIFEEFQYQPQCNRATGAAASGTTGHTNLAQFPETSFEYHIKGTQTIVAPVATAVGLDIGMDQTADDGVEFTNGILSRCPVAFTVGTDQAVSFRCKFKIEDVSGTDDCAIGWRKAEAYQGLVDDYDEACYFNVISGDIKIEKILNNAATVTVDTTQDWTDGQTKTLQVNVAKTGAVTFTIDAAAPTVTTTFTFDAGEVIVPFFYLLNDTDLVGKVELIEWEVGFTTDN